MNSNNLVVAIIDGNGKIMNFQSLDEFQNGKKNIEILKCYAGRKLFNILVDEVGAIKYEDNKVALQSILELNLYKSSMKLLGKVAEAVLVRECKENSRLNKICLSKARRMLAKQSTVEKFEAIGTGLLSTRYKYPSKYNPSDTQRDIIWINKENGCIAMMKDSNSTEGIEAGLQIKVSGNGINYFLKDLINIRYEVPVVYFDICNDFDNVAEKLYIARKSEYKPDIIIGEDFIKGSALSYSAHMEILYYAELIDALINGDINPEELISGRPTLENKTLKNALTATMLSEFNINNIILP